jgi:signal transduction histidine kinase
MTQQSAPIILIVDDEAPNRRLLETLLRPEGYLTLSAANGEEALASVARQPPDLILLDIMMPGMDGYQVASILKADPATSNIPIIMVTSLTDRSARLVALDAGAEEIMTKPVDRGELWLRVRNMLRLKSLGDARILAEEDAQFINAELEERVRLRTEQLQLANDELKAFSYSVSHDLRTPLSTIGGFSSLLGREIVPGPASERSVHYLSRISAGVVRMEDLIEGMLALSQLSRATLQSQPVDLTAMAQAVADECRDREPARPAQVDIQPGMTAEGDARLLRLALDNLLGNAWKFSRAQPDTRISFSCESSPGGTKTYAVRDNGAGFDMAHSDKLFGPFQRLHGAEEFPGTGIGLATVRRVVMLHGGNVWAESTPGEGASFFFTLGALPDAAKGDERTP